MNMNYIFLLKNKMKKGFEDKEIEREILKKLFINVTEDKFDLDNGRNKEIRINYSTYYDKKCNIAKLKISFGAETSKDAKVLNEINNLICKNKLRQDYSIIVTYDGVSSYFCKKAYPLLGEFERRLRELIYIILVNTFGIEWYNQTVSKEIGDKIKASSRIKNNGKLIEKALEEMTISDLETYLFEPYCEKQFEELFKNKEELNKVLDMSKEDIASLLEKCIPKSLWDRYFKDKIDDIQVEINEIREFRNIVAHNKNFGLKEYKDFEIKIKSVNLKIKEAIEEINGKEIDDKFKLNSCTAYNNMELIVSSLVNISSNITENINGKGLSLAISQLGKKFVEIADAINNKKSIN